MVAERARKKAPENRRAEAGRRRNGTFAEGSSGNPGGRPREERELVEALRLRGLDLAEKLVELGLEGNVKAIEAALNRAYGKPKETVELTGAGGGPVSLDAARLTREERDFVRKIWARLGVAEPAGFKSAAGDYDWSRLTTAELREVTSMLSIASTTDELAPAREREVRAELAVTRLEVLSKTKKAG